MPYNTNMSNAYGQMFNGSYGQQMMYPQSMQLQPQGFQASPVIKGEIEWVDGEVGAKAYQVPPGITKPIALWDTNDTVIYLKSVNQYGIPNPIQKIHYRMEEMVPKYMGQDQARLESGEARQEEKPDMSEYIRREELDSMKEELMSAIHSMQSAETKGARANGKSAV